MKKILVLLLVATLVSSFADAQSRRRRDESLRGRRRPAKGNSCPRVYLGLSTGINNHSGLIGPNIDVSIVDAVSVGAGVGLSTWGTKVYAEGRYYFKPCNRGWALGLAITHSTGFGYTTFNDVDTKQYGTVSELDIKGDPMTNLAFSGYHFFNLGHRSNRFYLQAGYSVPLTEKRYYVEQNVELTNDADAAFKAIAPGGIILALGFSFGLGG